MKTLLFFVLSTVCLDVHEGYIIADSKIEFRLLGHPTATTVFVSGNFNQWVKEGEAWRMAYDKSQNQWILSTDLKEVRKNGNDFCEFTFRVDGVLIDANPKSKDVIFCAGYGHRYVIR